MNSLDSRDQFRYKCQAHAGWRSGAIAQLGERLNGIQEVRGSTPLGSTTRNLQQFPDIEVSAGRVDGALWVAGAAGICEVRAQVHIGGFEDCLLISLVSFVLMWRALGRALRRPQIRSNLSSRLHAFEWQNPRSVEDSPAVFFINRKCAKMGHSTANLVNSCQMPMSVRVTRGSTPLAAVRDHSCFRHVKGSITSVWSQRHNSTLSGSTAVVAEISTASETGPEPPVGSPTGLRKGNEVNGGAQRVTCASQFACYLPGDRGRLLPVCVANTGPAGDYGLRILKRPELSSESLPMASSTRFCAPINAACAASDCSSASENRSRDWITSRMTSASFAVIERVYSCEPI